MGMAFSMEYFVCFYRLGNGLRSSIFFGLPESTSFLLDMSYFR